MAFAQGSMKPEGQARHRVPTIGWTDVLDVPYTGPSPDLPPAVGGWPEMTVEWWRIVRKMPHCVLWKDEDWDFAIQSAVLHARVYSDIMNAPAAIIGEFRKREAAMGFGYDARQTLRIRYIKPGTGEKSTAEPEEPTPRERFQAKSAPRERHHTVPATNIDEYRNLYG